MDVNIRIAIESINFTSRDQAFLEKYIYAHHNAMQRERNATVRRALGPLIADKDFNVSYFALVRQLPENNGTAAWDDVTEAFEVKYKDTPVANIRIVTYTGNHKDVVEASFARGMQLLDNDMANIKGAEKSGTRFELRGMFDMFRPVIRDLASVGKVSVGVSGMQQLGHDRGEDERLDYTIFFEAPEGEKGALITFSLCNLSGHQIATYSESDYGAVGELHARRQTAYTEKLGRHLQEAA